MTTTLFSQKQFIILKFQKAVELVRQLLGVKCAMLNVYILCLRG